MSKEQKPSARAEYSPEVLEAPLRVGSKSGKLFIGIPKENTFQERRVGLTPSAVSYLVNNGHQVVIESKAGEGAHFYDIDYTEAGAEVTASKESVYKANIIIKSAPADAAALKLLQMNQILFSPIHLPTLNKEHLQQLLTKRVTAIAFEYIRDESNTFPIVRSMSEIAGNAVPLIAGEYLSGATGGKGVLLGGISGVPPTKVIILGAGVVGEYATRASIGLGAQVKVFDNSVFKLMRLQNNIGSHIYTSTIDPAILAEELKTADVVIGAIHSELGRTPILVTEQMVANMKAGAVIIDVSIDQGGVFETSDVTSHEEPVFKKYDVIHYCVPNIAARYARTASSAISNVIVNILNRILEQGSVEQHLSHTQGTRHGVYAFKGCLTNKYLSERFSLKYTDLDLIFAAGI